jgi:hypothetical protein
MKQRLFIFLAMIAVCLPLSPGLILAQAADEQTVDLVRLRLLRGEIRRWMHEGSIPDDGSFDDWAFGGEDGEKRFRGQLDSLLASELQALDRTFQLTEAQRRKLRLAGRGDIKHLLDQIDDSRTELERACEDIRQLPALQASLLLIDVRVSKGLFQTDSILAKTLRKMHVRKELTPRAATTAR